MGAALPRQSLDDLWSRETTSVSWFLTITSNPCMPLSSLSLPFQAQSKGQAEGPPTSVAVLLDSGEMLGFWHT